ncbi:hypothetical protein HID58_063457 [Brassica napus]|uniref:U11/U12 small nuclear ribonucleoprotein 35 kDa protein n=2 Tax=Brassica napus TaxID=3708 RepID=A0ABQ8A5G1_BRANA|nr:hypothetical protein HID58_063457 [Brassica napus]CDY23361.1 BnaC04g48890D [Brassica napus]
MYKFLITHYKVSLTFKLCLFSCLSPERGGFFKTSRSHREREEKKENERRRKQQRSEQQAGSIDGTDVAPHDNGVRRALLCYNAGLYDPSGDSKAAGDPYCTLFVGRISHLTTEETLREAMSRYGKVKSLRLVRHIVTGASRGYAFVEYETEKEMRRAYEDAHHSFIDGREIIVDYNRQQLMPGWIPRRLGGGLGGRKESGQLRFGGRDRPFRAPLYALYSLSLTTLQKHGIQLPPEGRYNGTYSGLRFCLIFVMF